MSPSTGPDKGESPAGPGRSGAERGTGKIRRGRYGLSRAELEVYHRDRILDATLNIVGIAGYSELSVSSITELSGVTRQAFYALYESPEAAFLDTYRDAVSGLLERMAATQAPTANLDARLAEGIEAAVDYLVAEPVRAALLLVEVHAAGATAVELQQRALTTVVDGVAELLAQAGLDAQDAARGARFGVGAVNEALRTRITRGELQDLPAIVPDLRATAFPMATEVGSGASARDDG
ncbi:MAG: TetR/AcrR family transcriptional regulator [Patulibacter sp.]|nr:TetR/AcrR family transcriptional regulator [Patulibacter sp.]